MYTFDETEARKADTQGNQIKEIGKYVGTITQAEDITAKTGTKGIALSFTANNGQKTKLSIYTMKADGSKIGGYSMLNAMLRCLGVRTIAPKPGKVTHYNYDTKAEEVKDGQVFPDLCKPIGILLETEDFTKQDGSIGTRMVLRGVFQASTELTASEILDRKTTPEALPKMVAALRHHPLKAARPQAGRVHGGPMPDDQFFGDPSFDDGSDIPFN